jgi:hypothetical protein
MLGLPIFSWWSSPASSDAESEIPQDIRQALVAVGSPLVSWLEERNLEEAS